jgi:phosphoribosylamine-glycine ligase
LGPLADEQEWVVEHEIKTKLETGGDSYNVRGKWPQTSCFGIEKKDCGYVLAVVPTDELPEVVQSVHNALSPAFEQYDYRGFYSSEIRCGEDGQNYLIDNTNRYASPPGEIMQEMITNLPQIIEAGARGQLVDMKCRHKYACELILYSDFSPDEWQAVQYPESIAHCVKLYNCLQRNGTMFVTPVDAKLQQIGAVSGFGDTIKEAMTAASENAKLVKGDRIEVKDDLIPSLLGSLHEAKKNGIQFGDSVIPDEI